MLLSVAILAAGGPSDELRAPGLNALGAIGVVLGLALIMAAATAPKAPSWWRHSSPLWPSPGPEPWPPGADSPSSRLRSALRTIRWAAKGPWEAAGRPCGPADVADSAAFITPRPRASGNTTWTRTPPRGASCTLWRSCTTHRRPHAHLNTRLMWCDVLGVCMCTACALHVHCMCTACALHCPHSQAAQLQASAAPEGWRPCLDVPGALVRVSEAD